MLPRAAENIHAVLLNRFPVSSHVTHQAAAAEPPCAAALVRRSPQTLRQKKADPALVHGAF
jgi:hypothetical protein